MTRTRLLRHAKLVATMDDARREIADGGVPIRGNANSPARSRETNSVERFDLSVGRLRLLSHGLELAPITGAL